MYHRTPIIVGVVWLAIVMAWSSGVQGVEATHRHSRHPIPPDPTRQLSDSDATQCIGEFQLCSYSGECVLQPEECGSCKAGEYRCPLSTTCVPSAADYINCPGLDGTVLDWKLGTEERIDALLKVLPLSDQIMQLQNAAPALPKVGIPAYNWLNDDVHAVMQHTATVFPDGCGLGATWNRDALFATGYLIGKEARGTHNTAVHSGNRGFLDNGVGITTYAPNLNLVRDPRWGRSQEVYGEDPFLTGRLTVSYVTGQQGVNETETKYAQAGACCKHFAAYDVENRPVDRAKLDAQVPTRDMWESFLPAFEACVVEAKASSVMCSYNAINGVPTCADPNLLNGVLRQRWNFTGFVVSDYDAWANLVWTHHYCADQTCAAASGINAGMDQEGGGSIAISSMQDAVNKNLVTPSTIGNALRRLMRTRIALGMLDPPTLVQPFNSYTIPMDVQTAPHLEWSREIARQSMCLYRNEKSALPITLGDESMNLLLIGPQIVDGNLLIGNYAQEPSGPDGSHSILKGIWNSWKWDIPCSVAMNIDYHHSGQQAFKAWSASECAALCATAQNCTYYTWMSAVFNVCYLNSDASGATPLNGVTSGTCKSTAPIVQWVSGCADVECASTDGFAAAVASVPQATHVLITFGLDQHQESEAHDRSVIELPGNQYELLTQVKAAANGKQKIICVLVHGGTFALQNLLTDCDAILDAWYGGSQSGLAISDVLFGQYNPAGRTPVTWYKQTSDLPPQDQNLSFYPNKTTGSMGVTYRYFQGTPDLSFGYGLSYSTFQYSHLAVAATAAPCDKISVTVLVANVGSMDGDEVVQLYVRQPSASVPVPQIRLAGFERVHLKAGAPPTQVKMIIEPAFHSIVQDDHRSNFWHPTRVVEAGVIEISVGGGQPQSTPGVLTAKVTITATRNLDTC